ncbi:LysR family transcriptional regulator [Oxalobacteraceae bacterium OM1]|nr:LysR family transcriptional regulator [Oxalobacteraceae bacterium OM1]
MDQLAAMRAFTRVVEAGTFTKAADLLDMPNATVTKLVQSLEQHLRVKLLQRTTRRVSVTPEGATYYEKAVRLLAELDDIDSGFQATQNRPRGRLRVDMGSSTATLLVIPALPEFLARYPEIQIDVGISDRHVDLISDNVDCVIRGGELTDLSLVARPIGKSAWVTCASPGYLKERGTPRHPSEIEQSHLVAGYVSTRTSRVVPMRFARGAEEHEIIGTPGIRVNESNGHVAAALAGLGIIQTFWYMARSHVQAGTLVPILDEWRPARYPFYVVYPPNRYVSNRQRVFIDWLADRFGSMLV